MARRATLGTSTTASSRQRSRSLPPGVRLRTSPSADLAQSFGQAGLPTFCAQRARDRVTALQCATCIDFALGDSQAATAV
eukprot:11169441-Alexandrium_andersonii.AAC.1